jgi:hypothetical protein
MFDQLDDYVRRPMHYENIDGIGQLGIGILWMGIAALEALETTVPEGSIWHRRGPVVICLLAFGAIVLFGMWTLKSRITFPRTGYVKYRGLSKPWVGAAIAAVIAVPMTMFTSFLSRHSSSSASLPVAVGSAGFALVYAFATRMEAAWNWVVLVVMVAGPVAISKLPIDRQWGQGPSLGFLGLTFLVSGAITLYLYLHRTRPPDEGAPE